MDYVPYHDGIDPCLQEIPARRARSGVIVIVGHCQVDKKIANRLGFIALGTAWKCCGKVLRRFHQSCDDEAYNRQINNSSQPPINFAPIVFCDA